MALCARLAQAIWYLCAAAGDVNSEEGRALVEKYHALFSAGLRQVNALSSTFVLSNAACPAGKFSARQREGALHAQIWEEHKATCAPQRSRSLRIVQ